MDFTKLRPSANTTEAITAALERAKAMQSTVKGRVSTAKADQSLRLPNAASKAIVGGMPLDAFREIAFSAKADADEAIVTHTSIRQGGPARPTAPDAEKVYARLNASKAKR